YQAVSDIIFTNSAEAWEHLQYWNSVILTLTKSVAFVEELIVTLLGCADFRDLDAKLSHKVEADRIEAEFVQAQAETFGSDFTKIYSQLDAIYRKFGIEPIVNLATYSIDWLEVEGVGTEAQVAFPMNYEETSKARLYQCLEIVNSIRQLPEAHHWTKGDWYQFFDRSLVNFRRLWSGRHELARFCESNIAQSREWWNDRGFEGTENP